MALGSFVPRGDNRRVTMRAAGAINAGEAVKLGTNGVVVAGDGDTVYGFAASTAATGDTIAIYRSGRFSGTAATGFDPDMGDIIALAANHEVDGGSPGNVPLGVVIETDPASGGTVVFEFNEGGVTTATL